jgi:hypothetical protein
MFKVGDRVKFSKRAKEFFSNRDLEKKFGMRVNTCYIITRIDPRGDIKIKQSRVYFNPSWFEHFNFLFKKETVYHKLP